MKKRRASSRIFFVRNTFSEYSINTSAAMSTLGGGDGGEIVQESIITENDEETDGINNDNFTSSTSNLLDTSQTESKLNGIFIVILLLSINLLNYCDRFTLASKSNLIFEITTNF